MQLKGKSALPLLFVTVSSLALGGCAQTRSGLDTFKQGVSTLTGGFESFASGDSGACSTHRAALTDDRSHFAQSMVEGALQGALTGGLIGGLTAVVTGGDVGEAILAGAAGGAFAGVVSGYLKALADKNDNTLGVLTAMRSDLNQENRQIQDFDQNFNALIECRQAESAAVRQQYQAGELTAEQANAELARTELLYREDIRFGRDIANDMDRRGNEIAEANAEINTGSTGVVYAAPSPSYSPAPVYATPVFEIEPVYDTGPTYGEAAPIYSDPAPVYSDPAPVYSDPAPVYSDPAPVYSDPAPSYSDPAPSYSAPAPSVVGMTPIEDDAPKRVVAPKAPSFSVTPRRADLITVSGVNIRSGPGVEHPKIASVAAGGRVAGTGRAGDWWRVDLGGGRSGFVSADYLKPAPPVSSGGTAIADGGAKSGGGVKISTGEESQVAAEVNQLALTNVEVRRKAKSSIQAAEGFTGFGSVTTSSLTPIKVIRAL